MIYLQKEVISKMEGNFSLLPLEMIVQILQFLSPSDYHALSLTCTRVKSAVDIRLADDDMQQFKQEQLLEIVKREYVRSMRLR